MCQFKIATCGSVDLHAAGLGLFLRRAQEGEFALLCNFEIVDDRAHGRDIGAFKTAEGVERPDAEQIADPFFGAAAVKGRARDRGQRDVEIRD